MKKSIIFLMVFMVGCAYNPPIYNRPEQSNLKNKAVLDIPFEQAWQKTINTLFSQGYLIKVADKNNGIITTERKSVKLNETQADCGNIWGLAYTKDERTTHVQKAENNTIITVNTNIEGLFNAIASGDTKQLSCYSLGYLEQDLINNIQGD
ncbi:hypothetical protein BMS3Bbin08_00071 [bacterium BMS3Bbin08]|nr:hypothetical protein BMS3Bbin08_00071 [bacterium BMS3Bbin08]